MIDRQPVEVNQAERLAAFAAANKTLGTGNPSTAGFSAAAAGGGIRLRTAPAMEETIRGDDHAVEGSVRRERHDLAAHRLQGWVAVGIDRHPHLGLATHGTRRAGTKEDFEEIGHKIYQGLE